MADKENRTGITFWHKVVLFFMVAAAFNNLKSCLGQNGAVRYGSNSTTRSQENYYGKRDACAYISNQQYPYDWKDSNVGACVIKRPFQRGVEIITPIGKGVGEWTSPGNLQGQIATTHGMITVSCYGTDVTGSSRGICGIPIR